MEDHDHPEDCVLPWDEDEDCLARVRRDESVDNEAKKQLQEEKGFRISELIKD